MKSASRSGRTFSRSFAQLDREMRRLAGELGLRIVVGEGDVELGRAADLEAGEVGLEARDQPLLAEDQGHPLRAAALERLAVARPLERDDRVVAVLRAATLDRRERRVLVAQLLEDHVDPGVVDRVDLGTEVEVFVVAELDLGRDLDGGLEDERLALLGLDDLDLGVGQRDESLLGEGFAVGILDEVLDGLVEDRARAEMTLEDGAWRLARPEPGDPGPARQQADGGVDGAAQPLGGELDLEDDRRSGTGGGGDLHRRESIGRASGRGRWPRCATRRGDSPGPRPGRGRAVSEGPAISRSR